MEKNKKLKKLFEEGLICHIRPTERERYLHFFTLSSKENLDHAEAVKKNFPRWSIISAYYAMHDSAKLLLARVYNLHVAYKVHQTTIKALRAFSQERIATTLEEARKEFLKLANDLAEAKRDRVKAQYYTGTAFMKKTYQQRAEKRIRAAKAFIKRIEANK